MVKYIQKSKGCSQDLRQSRILRAIAARYAASKGSALLLALLIVAIVAAIVTELMWQQQIAIARTDDFLWQNQSMSLISVAWQNTQSALTKSFNEANQNLRPEVLPHLPSQIIDNNEVSISLEDLQAKININDLATPTLLANFTHFFAVLFPSLSSDEIKQLVQQIFTMITPNATSADSDFANLPYRVAHQDMRSIASLALVPLINSTRYHSLQTRLVALPGMTPININQASADTLLLLDPQITREAAVNLLKARDNQGGFTAISDFLALPDCQTYTIDSKLLTTSSNYFKMNVVISRANHQSHFALVFARQEKQGKVLFHVLSLQQDEF